ncbi:hypothetical protein ACXVUM_17855 [Williamsia sp. SKLECPSW1]
MSNDGVGARPRDWSAPDEFQQRIERDRLDEQVSFLLGESMERSALNLIGAYENVYVRVQYLRSALASRGADLEMKDSEGIPRILNAIAAHSSIAWPHDEFSTMFDRARTVRNKLAHMWWIHAVEGDEPNRVMTVVVPTKQGWKDTTWSTPMYSLQEVRESELERALESLGRMRRYVHALQRMANIFPGMPETPGDHLYSRWMLPLPWWLDDWGPESDHVRADQIRTDRRSGEDLDEDCADERRGRVGEDADCK